MWKAPLLLDQPCPVDAHRTPAPAPWVWPAVVAVAAGRSS